MFSRYRTDLSNTSQRRETRGIMGSYAMRGEGGTDKGSRSDPAAEKEADCEMEAHRQDHCGGMVIPVRFSHSKTSSLRRASSS